MTTLEAARQYLQNGFSVIPLCGPDEPQGQPVDKRGKKPTITWTEYQTRQATDEELVKWFENGKHNIGIVTGVISGITVVDFDTPEAIENAKSKGFPKGPLSKTAKGFHAFCQYEPGHRNFQKRADLPGIDLRAEGGYVVAAPSIHATGKPYAWVHGRGLDMPLPNAPEWLFAKSDKDKTPIADLYKAEIGNRNESLARLLGSWLNDHDHITLSELIDMGEIWSKGLPSPLPQYEVARTCQSIFDKHFSERRRPPELPEPLPLVRVTPQNDPFPFEVLPPAIRTAALRVREVVQAPIDLVCQSFLAAATLAVQPYVDVLIDGRRFPVSNNYIVEGISGERKSAVERVATGPIKDRQRKEGEQFHIGEKAFEAAHVAWEQKRKAAFKEDDKDVIEAMLKNAGEEPKHVQPVYLFSEPSFQGIERAFAEGRYTLGLFSDEGGRFLGGYAMSKENQTNTITGLSKLWDGDPLDRMRGGDGLTMLYGRRFSVHLMIQPALSGQLFGNSILTGQGFLSRCLCSYPASTIGNRPYKAVDLSKDVATVAYFKAMEGILDKPLPIHDRPEMGLNTRAITLTSAAKSIWIAFHDHVEALQKPGGDLFPIIGFASKAAEHAARIAGVLSTFQNPDVTEIGTEYVEAGITIAQFYLGEALRLFHASNDNPLLTLAEECFRYGTEKTNGVIGLRNLYQFGPNAVRNKETAMQVITALEEHYRAVQIPGGAVVDGKKNRDAWRLVPMEV